MQRTGRPRRPALTSLDDTEITVAQPTSQQALDFSFTAPIEKDGAFATYVTVPGSADLFGTRRAVKVAGTIDGHPFNATLMPSGGGPHWLPIRAALCKVIGKDRAGDEVTFHLAQRLS